MKYITGYNVEDGAIRGYQLSEGDVFFVEHNGKDYLPGNRIYELGGLLVLRVHYEPRKWYEFFRPRKIRGYDVLYTGW